MSKFIGVKMIEAVSILTCLTGFEVHGQAACVKPENFDCLYVILKAGSIRAGFIKFND
jgi:hypothetical protein